MSIFYRLFEQSLFLCSTFCSGLSGVVLFFVFGCVLLSKTDCCVLDFSFDILVL